MRQDSKIFIAGRSGLVGSAMERTFRKHGYENIIGKPSKELDLRCEAKTMAFFEKERPEYVILAAAHVGGILANAEAPADFLLDNLRIQNSVIAASKKYGIKRLLFLASSCIYPRLAPQPMKEKYLLDGKLETTNEGYALAKITGLKLCEYMNRQYHTNYLSVMPCNLYGIGDNFHPENSHLIPGLIRRFHQAKIHNLPQVTVWGTGTPRREIMCSDDLADACLFLLEKEYTCEGFINIGTGVDYTIREIAEKLKGIIDYSGDLIFDPSRPDGMPRKVMDISRIKQLGWQPKISLEDGLRQAYQFYVETVYPKEI